MAEIGLMSGLAVGIDLGGTQLRCGLVDRDGTILARASALTDAEGGPAAVLDQMATLIDGIGAAAGGRPITAIGAAVPGPLDSIDGVVVDIPTLRGWRDVPLRAMLEERFAKPVALDNDGIGAAVGEWRHGAGKGVANLVYITVSTGIGGGVIADGRVVRGRRGMAGHIGHMIINPHTDARCSCGATGCFEALAAGTALRARVRKAAASERGAALRELAVPETLDASHLFEAARTGDPLSIELVEEEADYLALGLSNILHLYSPDMIVIGGGVANGFDMMARRIEARIMTTAMPAFRDRPIVRAALGGNSGLIGAAMLAYDLLQ